MSLKLTKPIVFFDLETTGLSISNDRIVEISIFKILKNNNTEIKTWLINPGIDIPNDVAEIHGITNEKVKDKPFFKDIAREIKLFIGDSDLAGYNSNKFDIPLLVEEFLRCELEFDMTKRKTIDVQNIFHKKEKRTLEAAYKFYCNKKLENAHSAEADTKATYEILLAQLKKYSDLENDVSFLENYSTVGGKNADLAGFIKFNNTGEMIISFGKYKNKTLKEVWNDNPGYFSWIKNADFPLFTKKILENFVIQIKLENKLNK